MPQPSAELSLPARINKFLQLATDPFPDGSLRGLFATAEMKCVIIVFSTVQHGVFHIEYSAGRFQDLGTPHAQSEEHYRELYEFDAEGRLLSSSATEPGEYGLWWLVSTPTAARADELLGRCTEEKKIKLNPEGSRLA